jgi:hypothetical protein
MAQHSFYFASATAAAAWVIGYGLAAYSFGEAFANLASPAAVVLGLAATLIVLATPVLILRYEGSLLAKAEREFPNQRGVDLTQRYNSKVRARERTDSGIKNQIFKFRETARRQPNPFGCGGQKKQGFCCGEISSLRKR